MVPESKTQLATIIHLTDLHLYLDEDGNSRNPDETAGLILGLGRLATKAPFEWIRSHNKMTFHNSAALIELGNALTALGRRYDPTWGPMIIAHTGDVEVIGPTWFRGDETPHFLGLNYVLKHLQPTIPDAHWVHVYGNHDVWPGTFPIGHTDQHLSALEAISHVDTYRDPYPGPPLELHTSGHLLRVHRVNTVPIDVFTQSVATGHIGAHPNSHDWPGRATDECLATLASYTRLQADTPAIDVALMHHPPHPFATRGLKRRIGPSAVQGRQQLADRLDRDLHLQIVLAGHRHAIDPDHSGISRKQPPLPDRCLQLVANTPTAAGEVSVNEPNAEERARRLLRGSFSVYRLYAAAGLEVTRTLWTRGDRRPGFREGDEQSIRTLPWPPTAGA